MRKQHESGFAAIEALLILVIVAMVAGTSYFVWHAKQNTDKTLANTAKSQPGISKSSKVIDFASCKAAAGSKMLETFPEQCVAKDGKKFTDTTASVADSQKYLSIKEWGVKIPLSTRITATTYSMQETSGGNVVVLSDQQCLLGAIERSTDGTITAADGSKVASSTAKKVGTHYYAYIHPQAGCDDGTGNATNTELQLLAKQAVDAIVTE